MCRTRIHHLLPCGLILSCTLILVLVFAAGFASAAGPGAAKASGSNERIRELMTQRYEILQHAMKNSELMLKAGRMDIPTFQDLTSAMYRAQADLCTTDADRAAVYEKLVDALSVAQQSLERQALAGAATGVQVDQGKVTVLNARIDLERLRLGQPMARQ